MVHSFVKQISRLIFTCMEEISTIKQLSNIQLRRAFKGSGPQKHRDLGAQLRGQRRVWEEHFNAPKWCVHGFSSKV